MCEFCRDRLQLAYELELSSRLADAEERASDARMEVSRLREELLHNSRDRSTIASVASISREVTR